MTEKLSGATTPAPQPPSPDVLVRQLREVADADVYVQEEHASDLLRAAASRIETLEAWKHDTNIELQETASALDYAVEWQKTIGADLTRAREEAGALREALRWFVDATEAGMNTGHVLMRAHREAVRSLLSGFTSTETSPADGRFPHDAPPRYCSCDRGGPCDVHQPETSPACSAPDCRYAGTPHLHQERRDPKISPAREEER